MVPTIIHIKKLLIFILAWIHQSCCCSSELFQYDPNVDWGLQWCYSKPECSEQNWPKNCNERLFGTFISPINLNFDDDDDIEYDYLTSDFIIPMSQYIFPYFRISYRGNTIHIIPDSGNGNGTPGTATSISWSRLEWNGVTNQTYQFHSIHFHWGSNTKFGSEHTVNDKPFPMEIHLSYFNNNFTNMDEAHASAHQYSVFTIAIFVEAAPPKWDDILLEPSDFLGPIINNLRNMTENDYTLVKGPLNLQLFQSDIFYHYPGTYTAPSCRSNQWLIHKKPLFVPGGYLQRIRDFKPSGYFMEPNNFRKTRERHANQNIYEWHAQYS